MFGGVQGLYQSLYEHLVSGTHQVGDEKTHLAEYFFGAINDLSIISKQYCRVPGESRKLPLWLLDLSMKLHLGRFEQGALSY